MTRRPPKDAVAAAKVLDETEASVLRKVLEALWAYGGVEVMRNTVGCVRKGQRFIRYGLGVGSSDIVCCVAPYGRWLCLEVKRPKDSETTEAQLRWLAKLRAYGAVAAVVHSVEEIGPLVELARKATR